MTENSISSESDRFGRRTVLKGAGAATTMALAGCLGGGGDSSGVSVPGIYDMSGATSDVGRPAGIGSRDAIKCINNNDELDS